MFPSQTARTPTLLMALVAALALSPGASAVPPAQGPRHISVVSFAVSRDMKTATIGLAGADGVLATAPGDSATVADGKLILPLHLVDTDTQIIPIVLEGAPGGRLQIEWYPPIVYSRIGIESDGTILLFTTYQRGPNPARTEPAGNPDDSLAVHGSRWADARYVGSVPAATGAVDEQLLQLYQLFDNKNHADGRPMCPDSAIGIDTFWCMYSGDGFVWCGGFAKITRGMLRSAGAPARLLSLGAEAGMNGGVLVQTSEAHTSLELWTGDSWAWADPTFRILRATRDGKLLDLNDAIELLNNEATRDSVIFTREAGGSWVTQPYAELPETFRDDLARYISSDKSIAVAGQ